MPKKIEKNKHIILLRIYHLGKLVSRKIFERGTNVKNQILVELNAAPGAHDPTNELSFPRAKILK